MNFSDKLKKLRTENKITQSELADGIYISRSMIAKYENGLVYPSKEIVEKIAVYFNIKLSDLVDGDENVQISLDSLKSIEHLHNIISIESVVICFLFLIVSFIPFLKGFEYIYPTLPYLKQPEKYYYTWSIVYSCLKNGNPIALITFIMCIIDIALFTLWKFNKKKKAKYYLFVSATIIFILNIFLIIISVIFACGYAL